MGLIYLIPKEDYLHDLYLLGIADALNLTSGKIKQLVQHIRDYEKQNGITESLLPEQYHDLNTNRIGFKFNAKTNKFEPFLEE